MLKLRRLPKLGIDNQALYYRLSLAFGLLFLAPLAGFAYLALRYDLLRDPRTPYLLLVFLVCAFFGFTLLRRAADQVLGVSREVRRLAAAGFRVDPGQGEVNELRDIVRSLAVIEGQFQSTFGQLERKTAEIAIFKELADLCYVTFDPEEILHVTLERALALSGSDIGSVLILETQGERRVFRVKAGIGLEDRVRPGETIDFETSIAKYAVINKSPLVVEDVERDSRFGRANLGHYGTRSFICMPIKTSREILGVLNISRREEGRPYRPEDADTLAPLVTTAAFTYDNLRLLARNEGHRRHHRSMQRVFQLLGSSLRGEELLQGLLQEIRGVVACEAAAVLVGEDARAERLKAVALLADPAGGLVKDRLYPAAGTALGRAVNQEALLVVPLAEAFPDVAAGAAAPGGEGPVCALAPLRIAGRVEGLLVLTAGARQDLEDPGGLLGWMAEAGAFALERNRLFQTVRRRDRELDSIRQIGSALASSTFDMKKVLKYTMDMIRVIMNVEAGSLLLLRGEELRFAVAFNTRVQTHVAQALKLGQGIAGTVASKGEAIIVNDIRRSPHFFPGVDRRTGFETRSALCVPMISKGRVMGVIEVLNKTTGAFGPGDRDLLQSIAASVSIAIENARLYRETVSMAEHERGLRRVFQKFVPKEVLERILHGAEGDRVQIDELRTLTLLNLDIRGFSGMAREMGPQKTVALLNSFFAAMGGIVFKHHGLVDKYLGDGFLALFGAPAPSTRDADNALAAALEMQAALPAVNRRLGQEIGAAVRIGISIHTGEVVIGNIGFDMKMDYTVIGDAVNTVFRLQELTKDHPNGILMGENTRRACRSRFDLRALDRRLGDLRLYEVLGHGSPPAAEPAPGAEAARR